jgi:hypothetical protein
MGEKRNVCRILVGKPEGKKPLGRPRRRWVDNIKMDLHFYMYITNTVVNATILLLQFFVLLSSHYMFRP